MPRESIQKGVKTLQDLAVTHSDALWDTLTEADPETPMEAQMLIGAYMGALSEHIGIRMNEEQAHE